MEISREKTAWIGYGHATVADAFQSGREAAQMAKGQIPDGPVDLALAVGPDDAHFKDFIEGVRLVTGESALVGLPCPWTLSSDLTTSRARAVVLVHSISQRLLVVSAPDDPSPLVPITSLFTALRARRGNTRLDFESHGLIAIDSDMRGPRDKMAHELSADAGLESWIAGFSLWASASAPLICGSHALQRGIVGIECLSDRTWGVGWVDLASFPSDKQAVREAVRSAVRAAQEQLEGAKAAAALILLASKNQPLAPAVGKDAFSSAAAALPGVPLLGFPVRAPYARVRHSALSLAEESVTCILVPE